MDLNRHLQFKGSFSIDPGIIGSRSSEAIGREHYTAIKHLFESYRSEIAVLPDSVKLRYSGKPRLGSPDWATDTVEIRLITDLGEKHTELISDSVPVGSGNQPHGAPPSHIVRLIDLSVKRAKDLSAFFNARESLSLY